MYQERAERGGAEPAANSERPKAMNRFQVKKVAVLGAGVMGAQIAAHLVNVKVPVVLFDLPARPKDGASATLSSRNEVVTKAVEGLKKLKPSPLGVKDDAVLIQQANYEEHLEQLRDCDLDDRSHRRAHGLEAGSVPQDRALRRAACDPGVEHLGLVDHEAQRSAAARR